MADDPVLDLEELQALFLSSAPPAAQAEQEGDDELLPRWDEGLPPPRDVLLTPPDARDALEELCQLEEEMEIPAARQDEPAAGKPQEKEPERAARAANPPYGRLQIAMTAATAVLCLCFALALLIGVALRENTAELFGGTVYLKETGEFLLIKPNRLDKLRSGDSLVLAQDAESGALSVVTQVLPVYDETQAGRYLVRSGGSSTEHLVYGRNIAGRVVINAEGWGKIAQGLHRQFFTLMCLSAAALAILWILYGLRDQWQAWLSQLQKGRTGYETGRHGPRKAEEVKTGTGKDDHKPGAHIAVAGGGLRGGFPRGGSLRHADGGGTERLHSGERERGADGAKLGFGSVGADDLPGAGDFEGSNGDKQREPAGASLPGSENPHGQRKYSNPWVIG
ncbi:MAG: hypothetical protein LBG83_06445 [Oscillospiraceae bacterium]|jgi:hypothetical protein|nr:hypothetical protein [Oscillospiraceae bacterium]